MLRRAGDARRSAARWRWHDLDLGKAARGGLAIARPTNIAREKLSISPEGRRLQLACQGGPGR